MTPIAAGGKDGSGLMDDDITSRLQWACDGGTGDSCLYCDARIEIERYATAHKQLQAELDRLRRAMEIDLVDDERAPS